MKQECPPESPPSPVGGHARHGLALWASIAGVCLAALAATYMLFVEAPPPSRIVIAAGAENGAYHHFARLYAEELKKEGLTLEVRATAGSVQNLELLQDDRSGVSVAIVQSGVAGPQDLERLHALGSLYREPLWVFYRSAAPLERISQLAGKRLGVGPVGSGTHAIAAQLLAANGVADPAEKPSATKAQKKAPTCFVKDSVTGSAHAVLTPFWAAKLGRDRFTAFQASARGGRLSCRLDGDRAWLGGECVTVVEGRFFL